MSRQPQFDATQQVEAPSAAIQPDIAGAQGLTDLAQSVASLGSQSFIQAQTQKAETAGELAGLNPAFVPTTGGGAAQQAFNQAALQTNKQMVGTDITLKSAQFRQNAIENNPDAAVALSNYNSSMQQYAQQTLNNVPAQNRAFAQNMLTYHTGNTQVELQGRVLEQQKTKANAQWVQTDQTSAQNIQDAITNINFNAPPDSVAQQTNAIQVLQAQREQAASLAEQSGIITKPEFDTVIKSGRAQINQNMIANQYLSNLQDGSGPQFFQGLVDKPITGMTEVQKTSFLNTTIKNIGRQFNQTSDQNNALVENQGQSYVEGLKKWCAA